MVKSSHCEMSAPGRTGTVEPSAHCKTTLGADVGGTIVGIRKSSKSTSMSGRRSGRSERGAECNHDNEHPDEAETDDRAAWVRPHQRRPVARVAQRPPTGPPPRHDVGLRLRRQVGKTLPPHEDDDWQGENGEDRQHRQRREGRLVTKHLRRDDRGDAEQANQAGGEPFEVVPRRRSSRGSSRAACVYMSAASRRLPIRW